MNKTLLDLSLTAAKALFAKYVVALEKMGDNTPLDELWKNSVHKPLPLLHQAIEDSTGWCKGTYKNKECECCSVSQRLQYWLTRKFGDS